MQVTLPTCDVLCMSTLPQGSDLDQLIEWLDAAADRKVVVFEKGGKSPHRRIIASGRDRLALRKLAKEQVFLRFDFLSQSDEDAAFFATVEEMVESWFIAASDFKERGVDRMQNLLRNSCHFSRAKEAKGLFGSFDHIPAIICGAGPSLDSHIPYLSLLQERALIFAGGAALSRLTNLGVLPHFSGLIDPHPPRPIDKAPLAAEVPCFFQSRVYPEKISAMQGPLLWTPGSEQDFFEQEHFEVGWNVSTYLTAIACHLGCSPILLVGVDLSGDQSAFYSGGVEKADNVIELSSKRQTKRDWLLAARFLSDFAKKHPEVEWINASEGLEFGGFQKKKLQEVPFESQYDLRGMIHGRLAEIPPGVMESFSPVRIYQSLGRVSGLCDQLIGEIEKQFPRFDHRSGEYTILEVEIEREEAYAEFARPVWEIWEPVLARSLPQDPSAREVGLKLNQWLFIKGICDDARQIRS